MKDGTLVGVVEPEEVAEQFIAGVKAALGGADNCAKDGLGTDLGIEEPTARVFRGGERSSEESSRDIGLL